MYRKECVNPDCHRLVDPRNHPLCRKCRRRKRRELAKDDYMRRKVARVQHHRFVWTDV